MGGPPTLQQRARYAFDNLMARGTPALIGWLALATVAMIALFSAIVLVGDFSPSEERHGLVGQTFESLLHTLDPGTIAEDDAHWPYLLTMLLVTFGGLLVVSSLIGVIAAGLNVRIEEMRKGRSMVLEEGHTLIFGWSDTIFTVLAELEIANENEKRPSAVVLAERDKVEMDDLIREKVRPKVTRVVTRSGSPIDLGDLALVRPELARSIVILSPEGEAEPDAQVIKTILALTKGKQDGSLHRIVAEIEEPRNLRAANLVSEDEVVLIDKSETIARLVVHSARQSGASVAVTELLDFEGDEIYFREDPDLVGGTFGEALAAYEECSAIGLIDADGAVELNPDPARVLVEDDRVIAIAADDEQLATAAPSRGQVDFEAIALPPDRTPQPEKVLVLDWNCGVASVIREFDKFLVPGSELLLVSDAAEANDCLKAQERQVANTTLEFRSGNPSDREQLEAVEPERFDHVVVITAEALEAQRADARTLVTLLHLRDIADRRGAEFTVVSEMIDDRNRRLAEVTKVDDVIVSDKVISLMLTQISESSDLAKVFDELFSAGGSELYLRPASDYVLPDREVD
ncbi:MAG TPA: hypothetical protein VK480_00810, partial [Solirubrobacterales bacterium]|nr:hypothetical protein [Solirubrobacterales bacterium]